MSYQPTAAKDATVVSITLTVGQVKTLNRLVECDLVDAEQFGESMVPEKELQRLIDVFWPVLNIRLTPEEEKAHSEALRIQWAKDELEALCPQNS